MPHRTSAVTLLFLAAMNLTTAAHAAMDCRELFSLSSDGQPKRTIVLPARELRLKPEVIDYIEQSPMGTHLWSVSHIFKSFEDPFFSMYFPLAFRAATDVKDVAIMEVPKESQDLALGAFETTSREYKMAYSIIKTIVGKNFPSGEGGPRVFELDEAAIVLLAHLSKEFLGKQSPDQSMVTTKTPSTIIARLNILGKNAVYREILGSVIHDGIELLTLTSNINFEGHAGKFETAEFKQKTMDKLENGKPLNSDDIRVLALITSKLFYAKTALITKSNNPLNIPFSRQEFWEALKPSLYLYIHGPLYRLYTVQMFDYLYFGIPLAPHANSYLNRLAENASVLFLKQKNEYSQLKQEERDRLARESQLQQKPPENYAFTENLKDLFAPPPQKNREKTRGEEKKPKEVVVEELPEPAEASVEALLRLDPSQLGWAFTAEVPYAVDFLRPHDIFKGRQIVIFSKHTVDWIQDNPLIGHNMLERLKRGITTHDKGQEGIKALGLKTHNGYHIYEVKISEKFRMVLVLNGGLWHAYDVVEKDSFDNYISQL